MEQKITNSGKKGDESDPFADDESVADDKDQQFCAG